jgi:hypothetical protein
MRSRPLVAFNDELLLSSICCQSHAAFNAGEGLI